MTLTATASLLRLADAFCAATGRSKSRVATVIFNDGKKFGLIEAGGDVGTKVFERALRWFADNWPADTAWPEGVDRPAAPAGRSEAAA